MTKYTETKFKIPSLKGISTQNIEEHLKLYSGYVKNTNLVLEKIEELKVDEIKNAYVLGELQRRFAFEFGGMRNHEYYFASLEGGPVSLATGGTLEKAITKDFGSFTSWLERFKNMATTRGVGWAMLCYDNKTDQLLNQWVDEQHLGHLVSASPVLTLDMWEHAYVADYQPSGKKQYIEDFFENLNWEVIEQNFKEAIS